MTFQQQMRYILLEYRYSLVYLVQACRMNLKTAHVSSVWAFLVR